LGSGWRSARGIGYSRPCTKVSVVAITSPFLLLEKINDGINQTTRGYVAKLHEILRKSSPKSGDREP
jgi:hypothetical protein